MAKKKAAAAADNSQPAAYLTICRSKHWRYISSFHGPWLQLPTEILESLAHQNYVMPAPRLVDASVFYDVVRIRKYIDEAAHDSVRASTGINNPLSSSNGRGEYFGSSTGMSAPQLSRERIYKVRQKAAKLLSKAFMLDEVAASVATMQATSTVEDVGLHVLKRDPHNLEAKYVHYFLEKIPSRAMDLYTPLEPLDEIIAGLPMELQPAALRTRALVKIFQKSYQSAAVDLTSALAILEEQKKVHGQRMQQIELKSRMPTKGKFDWRTIPYLKEEEQPRGLEQQLYFNRAGVYLTMACLAVEEALGPKESESEAVDGENEKEGKENWSKKNGKQTNGAKKPIDPKEAENAREEAKKRVKINAKRALKNYLLFLSHLDYSPGLPRDATRKLVRDIWFSAREKDSRNKEANDDLRKDLHGKALAIRTPPRASSPDVGDIDWPRPRTYPASELFSAKPPPDLPPFPWEAESPQEPTGPYDVHAESISREAVTYHPLLTDALHSLLLTHALLQTSPKELQRHAYNAARLAKVADGYPIFQAARSPSRADWMDILRRVGPDWLNLDASWQSLCSPQQTFHPSGTTGNGTHLNEVDADGEVHNGAREDDVALAGALAASAIGSRKPLVKSESPEEKRERIKRECILEALSDDRVVDHESFQRAVEAHEERAFADDRLTTSSHGANSKAIAEKGPHHHTAWPLPLPTLRDKKVLLNPKRFEEKEYPITTERAEAVTRWVKAAPVVTVKGATKRKKKAKGGEQPLNTQVGLDSH
ncbi:hypothetical protein K470DRAFT_166221 [Piedraia hortae CBS 480.64]|uniref:Uncharacterized protein n=1 Tax=Piedraia hortae CBS 480.64 TaxID=1314780 RepID=A0A6A7C5Q6_9PEZI|nr:hypothetical protein K470DRAFT_166221 [Piedraia hortae CBS 480.64]